MKTYWKPQEYRETYNWYFRAYAVFLIAGLVFVLYKLAN